MVLISINFITIHHHHKHMSAVRYVKIGNLEATRLAIVSLDTLSHIAVDCEGENNRVSLVQLCDSHGNIIIIDFFPTHDLTSCEIIISLLESPTVSKVCFSVLRLERIMNINAIQNCIDLCAVGARLRDHTPPIQSLGELMSAYAVKIPFAEEAMKPVKNWFGRPLSRQQCSRAERQVSYLIPLYLKVLEDLECRNLTELCTALRSDVTFEDLRDCTVLDTVPATHVQAFKAKMAKAKRDEHAKQLAMPSNYCYHFHALGHCSNHPCKYQH